MNKPTPKAPILPTRPAGAAALPAVRQPFRVLHTSRAPAQLSLFLRPSLAAR
ncbi:MAG TPA: hypothetical protein VNU71_12530 [Burkholderiaceae bacterium]|nr:hypothetical protein [Burkholderiaceae bacterium]